jgi:hypothetical protein
MADYLANVTRLEELRAALAAMWSSADDSVGRAIEVIEEYLTRIGKPPTKPGIPNRLMDRLAKFEKLFSENAPEKAVVKQASQIANAMRRVSVIRHDMTHGQVLMRFDGPTVEITPSKGQRIRPDLKYKIQLETLEHQITSALAGFAGQITGMLRSFHPWAGH